MRFVLTFLAGVAVVVCFACGGDPSCGNVCAKNRECFNANLDLDDCNQACNGESAADPAHQQKAMECADCYATRTCAEILSECFDDCLGVRIN